MVFSFSLSVCSIGGRLAVCNSPYVLVLYITTTPDQAQAPNPKKFSGALQVQRRIEAIHALAGVKMGRKLLFVLGIVLAHGALAAGWVAQDAPRHRDAVVTSCARLPSEPLHISPQRELLAYVALRESPHPEVFQP
jgi:hypothetical protein